LHAVEGGVDSQAKRFMRKKEFLEFDSESEVERKVMRFGVLIDISSKPEIRCQSFEAGDGAQRQGAMKLAGDEVLGKADRPGKLGSSLKEIGTVMAQPE